VNWIDGIQGVLLDVDGTLLNGKSPIPGAAGALERIRENGARLRLTTNTTRRPRSAVVTALGKAGISVERDEVIVPASLARQRILESGRLRTALMVPEECLEDLEGVSIEKKKPDWVVLGDLAEGFTYQRLNEAFRWLRQGATLLALQRNRYWKPGDGEDALDAGPFVAALEYAAETEAELVGKPARPFFDLALADLDLPADRVVVIGDDLENDHRGGAAAGCRTILVRTGKFTEDHGDEKDKSRPPDLILDSIADLLK
jgi:phospholysine phosphohistidine inorganic pyrophosphate phosphatase